MPAWGCFSVCVNHLALLFNLHHTSASCCMYVNCAYAHCIPYLHLQNLSCSYLYGLPGACRSRGDGMSELIVVTVIVAAEGGVKVPKITSREDLTKALNKLGALRSDQVHPAFVHSHDFLCKGCCSILVHDCLRKLGSILTSLHVTEMGVLGCCRFWQ